VATFRSFLVRMPSELRYWTVLDPAHRVVVEADDFLLHHRLGRDGAESTSQSYAASLALFFDWAASIRKPWRERQPSTGCWRTFPCTVADKPPPPPNRPSWPSGISPGACSTAARTTASCSTSSTAPTSSVSSPVWHTWNAPARSVPKRRYVVSTRVRRFPSPLTVARRRDVDARGARVAHALDAMRTEGIEITLSSVAARATPPSRSRTTHCRMRSKNCKPSCKTKRKNQVPPGRRTANLWVNSTSRRRAMFGWHRSRPSVDPSPRGFRIIHQLLSQRVDGLCR
jgi:hypothetical protein